MTWDEAERALTPETLVLLPLGAAAKEHGLHLPLENDLLLAEALAARVLERIDAVCAPTIPYHHYPPFSDFPGSTTLRRETARDLVVDIVRSLARFGPRRFYVLNTGLSTMAPLADARAMLEADGLVVGVSDIAAMLARATEGHLEQARGTHADETETSLMLHLAPHVVRMERATREEAPIPLRRATHPSGVYGDATRASAEKGALFAARLVDALVVEIESLRRAGVPR